MSISREHKSTPLDYNHANIGKIKLSCLAKVINSRPNVTRLWHYQLNLFFCLSPLAKNNLFIIQVTKEWTSERADKLKNYCSCPRPSCQMTCWHIIWQTTLVFLHLLIPFQIMADGSYFSLSEYAPATQCTCTLCMITKIYNPRWLIVTCQELPAPVFNNRRQSMSLWWCRVHLWEVH